MSNEFKKYCHLGSCQRTGICMYTVCRAIPPNETSKLVVPIPESTHDDLLQAYETISHLRSELASIALRALTYQVGQDPIETLNVIHRHAKELSKNE